MRRGLLIVPAVLLVGGAGVVVGLAGSHALSAAGSLEQAQSRLTELEAGAKSPADAGEALRTAARSVAEAEATLGRWPVDVVAAVPVLGRSWDAERAVAATARHVLDGAVVLAEGVPQVRASAGGVDLAGLAEVRSSLSAPAHDARAALERLRTTPTALTPPQVGQGVEQALSGLAPAVDTLQDAHAGLGLVHGLLGGTGPRSVLVMLQNNAELRGAGGYAATFALGRLEQGRLTLGPLRDVMAVADPPSAAHEVPAPEEYVQDYAALAANTTMWRSWNMSPDVPDSALVGARIASALLDVQPDVVVLLDVPAMAAVAGLHGEGINLPDGSTVSADELADALLVDAYASAGVEGEAQERRRGELQTAATTAVSRLLAGEVPAADVARTLLQLTDERHLSVWSARPQEQQALVALGAAGDLEASRGMDLSHVSVNNIGGNKLDVYVDRDLEVHAVVGRQTAQVVQRVRFTNRAPEDLVPYVAGVERPGVVVSRVELSLPPTARDVRATVDGKPRVGPLHTGPSRQRLIHHLELPRGASAALEVRYAVPSQGGAYRLRLVPQPLVDDADLLLSVQGEGGQPLGQIAGAQVDGGAVREASPLTETREIVASLRRERQTPPSRWERLRSWWGSPVRLG